jgi:hypothetical protein
MHNLPLIAAQRRKPIGSTTASDSSNAAHFTEQGGASEIGP